MSENSVRRYKTKVTMEQLKLLIDFLSQHGELAAGTYRTLEARHHSKILWAEAAKLLNGYKGGIKRPSHGWSKYWSDFKIKLKNKLIELKRKKLGVIKKEVSPMTKLEMRALHILGPNFEKKYVGEEFEDPPTDPLPPEIKQESVLLTNGYYRVHNENGRLSESEGENSPQQSDDDDDDDDEVGEAHMLNESHTKNSTGMSGLYPQWLVDVEKKRANAELRRAKADEEKAAVAAKNAEAAFVQSQAIKKLAEAAEKQADAMLRIATLLESRRPRDDLLNL